MTGPSSPLFLPPHRLKVALFQPQIAPNTGNVGRLCVATGTELHLVRPMGFVLSDHQLKRSAMDYWPRLRLTVHDDDEAFFAAHEPTPFWLFSTKASRSFWDVRFTTDDCLIFGSETQGLPEALLGAHADRALRIPQAPDERCLNLSTSVGIALYEALRQLGAPGKPNNSTDFA
jgi:tRNA (cytidine/uridine-2'-O-)-methyltransferase